MISGLLFAAALSALPPALASADEAADYEAMLDEAVRDADATYAGSTCPEAAVEHVLRQPIEIGGRPDLAAMRERVKVTGCGRTSIQNINVVRFGGSPPWRMATGLPGDSIADMMLQQGAWPSAVANAHIGAPADCQGRQLRDVYVAARPGHVDTSPGSVSKRPGHFALQPPPEVVQGNRFDFSRAWVEVWPFTVCGKDRTLGVVFLPLKGESKSAFLFIPLWREVEAHGSRALPAPDPGN